MYTAIDTVKSWIFPLSATALFCVYPLAVLAWTIIEGRNADGGAGKARSSKTSSKSKLPPLTKRVHGLALSERDGMSQRSTTGTAAAVAMIIGSLTIFSSTAGFIALGSGALVRGASKVPQAARGEDPLASPEPEVAFSSTVSRAVAMAGFVGAAGLLVAARLGWSHAAVEKRAGKNKMQRKPSGMLRRCASSKEVLYTKCENATSSDSQGVRWYSPPPDSTDSMWHHVDLHVKSWLDEDTGLYRYVNEIPRGALQKFELMTHLAHNVIREDAKGSRKLKSFNHPVPFNYGCFPQTFRDPQERDELYDAPGDNDPLDVLDLTPEAVPVGKVVRCRPLGAVCLIDEGQADWKIIVVNTEAKGPLAEARTIADAERLAPGRIEEALRWMDEFKQHSSKSETTLHYEIHDAARAMTIIEKDHSAWRRLVAEAEADGTARGHWIRTPVEKTGAQVLSPGWATPLPMHQQAKTPPLTGVSTPSSAPSLVSARSLTMRRQNSTSSDDSTSGTSSPRNSDAEYCA